MYKLTTLLLIICSCSIYYKHNYWTSLPATIWAKYSLNLDKWTLFTIQEAAESKAYLSTKKNDDIMKDIRYVTAEPMRD